MIRMRLRLTKGIRNNKPDWRLYVNGIIRFRMRRIGLGDLVEMITTVTGIKWAVKKSILTVAVKEENKN